MKIQYIGTGAADWLPKDRQEGQFFRNFSCVKINEDLLIDLASTLDPTNFSPVDEIIYTHSHNDHFGLRNLKIMGEKRHVTVYCESHFAKTIVESPLYTVIPLEPFVEVTTGKGYTLIPVPASHQTTIPLEQPLNYILKYNDQTIFFGTDGAYIQPNSYDVLRYHAPYDRMIFDGTLGFVKQDTRIFTHNSLPMVYAMIDAFSTIPMLKEQGQYYITHMSRFSQLPHEELVVEALKHDLHVTYDGLIDQF